MRESFTVSGMFIKPKVRCDLSPPLFGSGRPATDDAGVEPALPPFRSTAGDCDRSTRDTTVLCIRLAPV